LSKPTLPEKVDLPQSQHEWNPAPLVGQVVLITTLNDDGSTNIAPKCWVSMIATQPPTLTFNCNVEHWTSRNVLKSKEFVVNIPGAELVDKVWTVGHLPHPRSVEAAGFTPIPAVRVKPPRVAECRAHLECTLERHLWYGTEVSLFGTILAASADASVVNSEDPFSVMRSFVYLKVRTYGVIGEAKLATPSEPSSQVS
jgi:flavin reductase (DIM6/NTAB) family NADH-FMN oxidoreductase RutF